MENKKIRALIVDDSYINLTVLSRLLKKFGVEVDQTQFPHEAEELYRNNLYDIVFLDYFMPDMDGVKLFDRLEKRKNVTFVMVTASFDEFNQFSRVLRKPVSQDEVAAVVILAARKITEGPAPSILQFDI